jgi:hypothetical protein
VEASVPCSLTIRWLVTHESTVSWGKVSILPLQVSWGPRCGIHTHPRDGRPAPAGWRLREGEWHSPNEQFHGQVDVRSACAAFWNEPLRIEKKGKSRPFAS